MSVFSLVVFSNSNLQYRKTVRRSVELALWCSEVKPLPVMPASSMSADSSPSSTLSQLLVNAHGKAAEDGLSPCASEPTWETWKKCWILALACPSTGRFNHLESEPVDGRCLSHSVSLCM